jgi:hypothetical protein
VKNSDKQDETKLYKIEQRKGGFSTSNSILFHHENSSKHIYKEKTDNRTQ